jgi:sugar O-acyltransferase (sialic acid O-acetyltransferase NeuD family)
MQLLIYGSGGLGLDLCDIAMKINRLKHTWDRIAFIDDIRKERQHYGIDVLRFREALAIKDEAECVIGLGEPFDRMRLYDKCRESGLRFTKLLDPSASISESVEIGDGTVVLAFASITGGARIEENTVIQQMVTIGHGVSIGNHSVLSAKTSLGGEVHIGERTYVGIGCNILERLHIGDDVIVSMGSNVYRDIEDEVIAMGSPARVIRKNEDHRVFK